MALAIRAAIDAVAYRLREEPELDLTACGRELAETVRSRHDRPTSGVARSVGCPADGSRKAE